MDKRDRFEEIFRERLYNLEYNPDAKLNKIPIIPVRRYKRFTTKQLRIAAVIVILCCLAGGNWLLNRTNEKTKWESPEVILSGFKRIHPETLVAPKPEIRIKPIPVAALISTELKHKETVCPNKKTDFDSISPLLIRSNKRLASNLPQAYLQKCPQSSVSKPKLRKWHFGMGSSNLGIAGLSTHDGGGDQYYSEPGDLRPDKQQHPNQNTQMTRSKTVSNYSPVVSTKVKHLCPISFGLSLSRPLNERWSFSTGLTYSYLRSKWLYEYGDEIIQRQRLHMLGIPLSFSYRLTNWQYPHCYSSVGILGEINIAGQLRNAKGKRAIRIPGTLWTAHAKLGLAYPLFRFVSLYAEGGCCYYFKYQGNIETIRTKNAFNLTGQIGIRLNF